VVGVKVDGVFSEEEFGEHGELLEVLEFVGVLDEVGFEVDAT
jgi:hypothetical protein